MGTGTHLRRCAPTRRPAAPGRSPPPAPAATPPRDTLPVGRVTYRLLLTYKFKAEEAGKYKPTVPLINK